MKWSLLVCKVKITNNDRGPSLIAMHTRSYHATKSTLDATVSCEILKPVHAAGKGPGDKAT